VLIEQLANKELHFQHIRSEEDLQVCIGQQFFGHPCA
jgi:hypothetical protein